MFRPDVESLVSPQLKTPSSTRSRRKSSLAKKTATSPSFAGPPTPGADDRQDEGDEFGDDFDEFEEGGDDAEFGDHPATDDIINRGFSMYEEMGEDYDDDPPMVGATVVTWSSLLPCIPITGAVGNDYACVVRCEGG